MRSGTLAMIGTALAAALAGCGSPGAAVKSELPPPTFVVPSPTTAAPPPTTPPASAPAPASSKQSASATPATYAFPVVGHNSYAHTHHDYPATDIITDCGNKVVAATSGTILVVNRTDTWKASVNAGATRGGLSVALLGDDGVRYYGSHLSVINANVTVGARVTTGQTLGKVGDTGDAGACHLHFGISPLCAKVGDWWVQRGTVYPWPYLDAWRKGGNMSAVAAVAAWKSAHGCPKKPLVDP
ncbi:MAG: peptidoglycan LD-endopeptidase LytH [Actinoplanes sp.]|nr:peptidoglycan LD-endopeptidase LytH [Actinoplanes sp.]